MTEKITKKILKLISKEYPYKYDEINLVYKKMNNLFDMTINCLEMSMLYGISLNEVVIRIKKKVDK